MLGSGRSREWPGNNPGAARGRDGLSVGGAGGGSLGWLLDRLGSVPGRMCSGFCRHGAGPGTLSVDLGPCPPSTCMGQGQGCGPDLTRVDSLLLVGAYCVQCDNPESGLSVPGTAHDPGPLHAIMDGLHGKCSEKQMTEHL